MISGEMASEVMLLTSFTLSWVSVSLYTASF